MEPKAAEASLVARAVRPITGFGFENLFAISQGAGWGDPATPFIPDENALDEDLAGTTTADYADLAPEFATLAGLIPDPSPPLPTSFGPEATLVHNPVPPPGLEMEIVGLPLPLGAGDQTRPVAVATTPACGLSSDMVPLDPGTMLADVTRTGELLISNLNTLVEHGWALQVGEPQDARLADSKGVMNEPSAMQGSFANPYVIHSLDRIRAAEALPPQLAPATVPLDGTSQAVAMDDQSDYKSDAAPPDTKSATETRLTTKDVSPRRTDAPEALGASVAARKSLVRIPAAFAPQANAPTQATQTQTALPAEINAAHPNHLQKAAERVAKPIAEAGLRDPAAPMRPVSDSSVWIVETAVRDDQFRRDADAKIPVKMALTPDGTGDLPIKEPAQYAGVISLARAPLAPSSSSQAPITPPPPAAALNLRTADWGDQLIRHIERMVTTGSQRIELSLRPKNLGEIQVMLDMRSNKTTVHLVTETAAAARLLSGAEDRLSQLLDQSGYRLSGFSAQEQGTGAHAGQHGQNGYPAPRRSHPGVSSAKRDDASEATAKSASYSGRGKSTGINMLA
ncbi:MAG: flagellar hook-length control protein FliK [Quisquiliibacterium sp.]